jgi:hypothetical protein
MALTRVYEEHELEPELKNLFSDVRASFDLPYVPTIFKVVAAQPAYLKLMWNDLGPVARSREFQAAAKALEEFVRSLVVSGGWRFSDQRRVLAGQKFSTADIEQLGAIVAIFARATVTTSLFARLMQRGYSGGQKGRVGAGKLASPLSRMITLHVPNERDAGIRSWLIYNDIKRTTNAQNVLSAFRVLSPFPGYLASVWLDSKKVLADKSFQSAKEQVAKRALGLLTGIPVKDHRAAAKDLTLNQWREIEEAVDSFARLLPQFALIGAIWQRSFPQFTGQILAA